MCDRWKDSYENFLADMGRAPSENHSIDRLRNSEGYSKENCRWATDYEQANNKRNNHFLEYKSERFTMSEWSRKLNIKYDTLKYHVNVMHRSLSEIIDMKKNI